MRRLSDGGKLEFAYALKILMTPSAQPPPRLINRLFAACRPLSCDHAHTWHILCLPVRKWLGAALETGQRSHRSHLSSHSDWKRSPSPPTHGWKCLFLFCSFLFFSSDIVPELDWTLQEHGRLVRHPLLSVVSYWLRNTVCWRLTICNSEVAFSQMEIHFADWLYL